MWFKYALKGRAGAFLRNLSKTKNEVTREKRLPLFYDETGKA